MSALSIARINQIDLVGLLAFINRFPERISGPHYWYDSPFHYSRGDDAHFHVNRRTNRWYDFAVGAGYSVADFGHRYFENGEKFLRAMQDFVAANKQTVSQPTTLSPQLPYPKVEIEDTSRIQSQLLIQQLWERRVPISVAQRFCLEARYTRDGRSFCSLALPTEGDGFILFNKNQRLHTGLNSPTYYGTEHSELAIFLDCMDMLTLASLQPSRRLQPDLLCLHQPENLLTILPRLETYPIIRLFFPNTTTGDHLTCTIQHNHPTALDYRPLYNRYSSLNEWVCHFGKGQPPSNRSLCPSPFKSP